MSHYCSGPASQWESLPEASPSSSGALEGSERSERVVSSPPNLAQVEMCDTTSCSLLLWTAASRQRDTGRWLPLGRQCLRGDRASGLPAPGGCASRRRGTEVRRARERRLRRVPDRRAEATPSTGVRAPLEPIGEGGSVTNSGGGSTTRTTGSTSRGDTTTYDSAR